MNLNKSAIIDRAVLFNSAESRRDNTHYGSDLVWKATRGMFRHERSEDAESVSLVPTDQQEMGSIIAKSYHSGQAGHNGGGGRLRGVGKRQTSKDLISGVEDLKIRGVEDLMAELVLEHPEWRCKGGNESGVSGKKNHNLPKCLFQDLPLALAKKRGILG